MRRMAGSSFAHTIRWVSSSASGVSGASSSGDAGESGIGRIRSRGGTEAAAAVVDVDA